MKAAAVLMAAVCFFCASLSTAQADIINGGFEDGYTGWVLSDPANTALFNTGASTSGSFPPWGANNVFKPWVSSAQAPTNVSTTFLPKEGFQYIGVAANEADVPVSISQIFSINQGQVLSGWAAFDADDALELEDIALKFNDYAFVRIGGDDLWGSSVSQVGDYGDDLWRKWSWTAPATGLYTLEMGVVNADEATFHSMAFFDGVNVVPEPVSTSLFLVGGAAMWLRRKRAAIRGK
jgi:hypothetical protein